MLRRRGFQSLRPSPGTWHSPLPAPVPERLVPVPARLDLGLPEPEVLVLARLDHLPGDCGTEDRVMALATRLAVVVHQSVAAGNAPQEVLVAEGPCPTRTLANSNESCAAFW